MRFLPTLIHMNPIYFLQKYRENVRIRQFVVKEALLLIFHRKINHFKRRVNKKMQIINFLKFWATSMHCFKRKVI